MGYDAASPYFMDYSATTAYHAFSPLQWLATGCKPTQQSGLLGNVVACRKTRAEVETLNLRQHVSHYWLFSAHHQQSASLDFYQLALTTRLYWPFSGLSSSGLRVFW
jgi:hypothetical protein